MRCMKIGTKCADLVVGPALSLSHHPLFCSCSRFARSLPHAARSENAILQAKVKELSAQVKILTVEKAALLAEVELYRQEAALPNFSQLALGGGGAAESKMDVDAPSAASSAAAASAFVKSGNGVYCQNPDVVLRQLHDNSNPLTVSMSPDETVLVSGGADRSVHFVRWGAVEGDVTATGSKHACRVVDFAAPVICVSASGRSSRRNNLVAAGGMDGSVSLLRYKIDSGGAVQAEKVSILSAVLHPHKKYVKRVEWSPNGAFLATAGADGNIHVYEISVDMAEAMDDDDDDWSIGVSHLQSLHLSGPVECLAFASDTRLLAHARGTAVLTEFNLAEDCAVSETNLNTNHSHAVSGGFEEHVSFCCLDMQVSPCRKFLALATDNHRHMVLDLATKRQVRNLYGHAADHFGTPVLAWSCNGQYLYCNDQHASALIVYDIAASRIVQSISRPHARPIKALWSSRRTNTLVTTSFDRDTVVWFAPAE